MWPASMSAVWENHGRIAGAETTADGKVFMMGPLAILSAVFTGELSWGDGSVRDRRIRIRVSRQNCLATGGAPQICGSDKMQLNELGIDIQQSFTPGDDHFKSANIEAITKIGKTAVSAGHPRKRRDYRVSGTVAPTTTDSITGMCIVVFPNRTEKCNLNGR